MHAEIQIDYYADAKLRAMSEEQYQRIVELLPALDLPVPRPDEVSIGWEKRNHLIDLSTTGAALLDAGLAFTVKRFKSTYKVADPGSGVTLNIAIPNLLLFSVDEVTWMENACTEELQGMLDERWRILAVCPPAAQRRPDYILGRQKSAQ